MAVKQLITVGAASALPAFSLGQKIGEETNLHLFPDLKLQFCNIARLLHPTMKMRAVEKGIVALIFHRWSLQRLHLFTIRFESYIQGREQSFFQSLAIQACLPHPIQEFRFTSGKNELSTLLFQFYP